MVSFNSFHFISLATMQHPSTTPGESHDLILKTNLAAGVLNRAWEKISQFRIPLDDLGKGNHSNLFSSFTSASHVTRFYYCNIQISANLLSDVLILCVLGLSESLFKMSSSLSSLDSF